jgi:hypothetical protein
MLSLESALQSNEGKGSAYRTTGVREGCTQCGQSDAGGMANMEDQVGAKSPFKYFASDLTDSE